MTIKTLGLEQFRRYGRVDIEFGPGLHILVGANASGKTSILEAISLLCVTKSHRTSADRELIGWGEEWARVDGAFTAEGGRGFSVRVLLRRKTEDEPGGPAAPRKSIELNSMPCKRLADIVGQAAVVHFGPDDLALIKGPPSIRRRFLNTGISQVRPAYLADLMRYRRALRQRNECLKAVARGKGGRELLAPWDTQLIESGAGISMARAQFAQPLASHMHNLHRRLSDGAEEVDLTYAGDLAEATDLPAKQSVMRLLLSENVDRDLALGRTSRGPHRDELLVQVNDRSLRTFGSQGQQRTAALSLTLAEAAVMQEWRGESPIVLLDDCLSELDHKRARQVLELAHSVEQMIVTTAAWEPVLDDYSADARVFDIAEGKIQERPHDARTP